MVSQLAQKYPIRNTLITMGLCSKIDLFCKGLSSSVFSWVLWRVVSDFREWGVDETSTVNLLINFYQSSQIFKVYVPFFHFYSRHTARDHGGLKGTTEVRKSIDLDFNEMVIGRGREITSGQLVH